MRRAHFSVIFVISLLLALAFERAVSAEPVSDFTLRFAPPEGQTLNYLYSVNLDKTTLGRTGNEQVYAVISQKALARHGSDYEMQIDIRLGKNNLKPDVKELMELKVTSSKVLTSSDRYVWKDEATANLCFPEEPVHEGSAWNGECQFNFGDLMTTAPLFVETAVPLAALKKNAKGTTATIECAPATREITAPFQMGHLGVQWDREGRVTWLSPELEKAGQVRLGDAIVAINGREAQSERDRDRLKEIYIEPLENLGQPVELTLMRDGQQRAVKIAKKALTLGTMHIQIKSFQRTVEFDVARGIPVSDSSDAVFGVTYEITSLLPWMQDSTGEAMRKFAQMKQQPERIYNYQWRLAFAPGEN